MINAIKKWLKEEKKSDEERLADELSLIEPSVWVKMSFAKLLGLKENISDIEIISMLSKEKEFRIGDTLVKKKELTEKGVSGDFGEPTPV